MPFMTGFCSRYLKNASHLNVIRLMRDIYFYKIRNFKKANVDPEEYDMYNYVWRGDSRLTMQYV